MAKSVGSAAWIAAEKENVLDLLRDEKEELVFPAQHEMEWLNEHMNEVFTSSHVNMTNVFKTPGKMHGKTPKTNRKRNAAETRVPLSDVFSAQPSQKQQSPVKARCAKPPPRFEIPSDAAHSQKAIIPSQADSGYHTSSQSQADPDETAPLSTIREPTQHESRPAPVATQPIREASPERRTTEGSFHSAKEDQTAKVNANQVQASQPEPKPTRVPSPEPVPALQEQQQQQMPDEAAPAHPVDVEMEDIGSPSDESTPERPVVRKGSLNFASLPAREPLKTSVGARISQPKKSFGPSRNSQSLHHAPHQPSPQQIFDNSDDEDAVMQDSHIEILGRDESDDEHQPLRSTNETAAQRLQKKIEMLGKAPAPRASKSIPSVLQMANRQSEAPKASDKEPEGDADDDDWIKPLQSPAKPAATKESDDEMESDREDEFDVRAPELIAHEQRMAALSSSPPQQRPGFGHAKSASTATLASPAKVAMAPAHSPAKSISVSNSYQQPTTTPQGSPRRFDLSASKSRLQSIMKSAKGLFTSSASISAAAKMETLSPNTRQANNMPGMFPRGASVLEDKPLPKSPPKEGRRTRSSTEREKRKEEDAKAMEKMDEQLHKAREKEAQKAATQKQQQASEKEPEEAQPQSKLQRPTKPIQQPIQKAKPAPVAIKVGTLSQRVPMGSSIANTSQETLPAEPKRPGLTKKASTSSISSNTHFKTSVHSQPTKPKALLAAERKREADEREAKRKAEAKRELERKREEARQQEAKQRAEAERKERERMAAEQAKRQAEQQAKQQAIERKRQEAARKAEQQRVERAAQEASRPPSRAGAPTMARSLVNHPIPTNPAKPAKRPVEEETARPQASKYGQASQQQDAKRRRTEDEQEGPRPTMSGAPIRQSNLGKKPSIFNHASYAAAPQASHVSQFPQPPNRMAPPQMGQYAHSKIPFSEAPNQPTLNKTPASASHKTPASAFKSTIQTVKSSPQYTPGEQIHLPEIPTDSEDEDSEDEGNAFPVPDWATPGHLTEQLIRQEAMDGDSVFGPIAPLKMEEIFAKGNKERLKRLRDRTSSANWVMSGDGLTLEEVKAYREQRERMRVQGGWVYGQENAK